MNGPRREGSRDFSQIPTSPPEIISRFSFPRLEATTRQIGLFNASIFTPFLKSAISLETVYLKDLFPCARYVLRDNLKFQQKLHQELLTQGIDTLHLDATISAIRFRWGDQEEVLTPPLIEVSHADNDALVVADGLHRISLARLDGVNQISALVVRHSLLPLPVMPLNWDEVAVVDSVPELNTKRKVRYDNAIEALGAGLGVSSNRAIQIVDSLADPEKFGYQFFFRRYDFSSLI